MGKFPFLQFMMIHTILPPCNFQFEEVIDFSFKNGPSHLRWDEPSLRTKGRIVHRMYMNQTSGKTFTMEMIYSKF